MQRKVMRWLADERFVTLSAIAKESPIAEQFAIATFVKLVIDGQASLTEDEYTVMRELGHIHQGQEDVASYLRIRFVLAPERNWNGGDDDY